jgi:hypothetical protein
MTTKPIPWEKLPLSTRIASILYPDHCDAETKKQMQDICDANGKKSPMQAQEALRRKR